MCVISVLPKSTKKDTEEVYNFIACAYNNNKEGSGYMFKRNGDDKISIRKGFFNLDNLLNAIKGEKLTENDELVVHSRTQTHGTVGAENCHPYVISTNTSEIVATDITINKPCLAHNGVFKGMTPFRDASLNYSDTYTFTKYYLGNNHILNIFKENKIMFRHYFSEVIHNSKIAVLYPDRDVEMFGEFIESNGYYHSNEGYCSVVSDYGGYFNRRTLNTSDSYDYGPKIGYKKPENIVNTSQNITDKVVLDGSFITLTEKNCVDFWYVKKEDWDMRGKAGIKVRVLRMDDYDPESINQLPEKLNTSDDESGKYICVSTERLKTHYYYLPKSTDLIKAYADYLKLITNNELIGKKTLKRLDILIEKAYKKDQFDTLFYHKLGLFVTKKSLVMYREFIRSNKVVVKDNMRLDGELEFIVD